MFARCRYSETPVINHANSYNLPFDSGLFRRCCDFYCYIGDFASTAELGVENYYFDVEEPHTRLASAQLLTLRARRLTAPVTTAPVISSGAGHGINTCSAYRFTLDGNTQGAYSLFITCVNHCYGPLAVSRS